MQLAINAAKLSGLNDAETKKIIDAYGQFIPTHDMNKTAPELAAFIQKQLVLVIQKEDPYAHIKAHSNQAALAIYEKLVDFANASSDKLRSGVAVACAGNIIDYGVATLDFDVEEEIASIVHQIEELADEEHSHLFQIEELKEALRASKKVLFVGDNAGEIVFDKLLLTIIKELYPHLELFFAVRGAPILNDVIVQDALDCGIDEVATIIDSGVPTPALILELASKEFLELYPSFDLIISKGQGNFEALTETDGPIFYLFITKCQAIMDEIGSSMRQIVLTRHRSV
jgi:uncharacterized protein with ATP-grasp and redox domains